MVSSLYIGIQVPQWVVSTKPIEKEETTMNDISFIGLDIAKQTFHLVGLNASGRQVLKKTL